MNELEIAKKYVNKARSSHDRGIEFNLSFSKYKRLLKAERCYYTGVRFTDAGDFKMTIDRIDASKGYTDENTVACTTKFNFAKGCLTIEQCKQIYKALIRKGL